MSAPRLSVVVVNWNGGDEAVENVRALAHLAERRGDVELIVVDNGSTDGSCAQLQTLELARVRLIANGHNAGFGPACNRGAAEARAPLLLFLNPDAAPKPGDDPFAPLLEQADADRAHEGFAPLLEDDERGGTAGESQQVFQLRRHWTLGAVARELLLLNRIFPRSRALRRERYLDEDRSRPFDVDQPAAAAWALRREVFQAVGGFDPRFVPAWWEDVDLARRLSQSHFRSVTSPASRFIHRGRSVIAGDATGPGLSRADFHRLFWRNLLRLAAKWWGAPGVLAVRCLLLAGGLLRLVAVAAPDPRARAERARSAAAIAVAAFGSIRF